MRHTRLMLALALVAAGVLSGCRSDQQVAQDTNSGSSRTSSRRAPDLHVPAGTAIDVTLGTALTSETASVGDAWTGSTRNALVVDGRNVIPAGSSVAGMVTAVRPARKGDRAMLDLGLASVTVDGRSYRVGGSTEAVIAGSPRARNLGVIAGSAAAGALVGNAVGGSGKGALIGALVGGGAATAAVSQTRGWQVVLKQGTPLTFTTSGVVAVRL